jgi:hypothetical protein
MRQEGLEPPTHSLEGCCSIHLSYWRSSRARRSTGQTLQAGTSSSFAGPLPHHRAILTQTDLARPT